MKVHSDVGNMKKQLKECVGCLCVVTLVTLVLLVLFVLLFIAVGVGAGCSLKTACAIYKSDIHVADILSFFTLIVTVGAAILALKSLGATRDSMRASVIIDAHRSYFSTEMLRALRMLYDYHEQTEANKYEWKHRNPAFRSPDGKNPANPVIGLQGNGKVSGCPFIDEEKGADRLCGLDEARRIVKGYFLNAYNLYDRGLIDKETLLFICDKNGITAFFMIVEPLEKAINSAYNDVIFRALYRETKEIYAKYMKTEDKFNRPMSGR